MTKSHNEAVALLKSLKEQLDDPVNYLWLVDNPEYLQRINIMVAELKEKLKS